MHLDMGDTPEGMQVEYVCRKTEEYGWGGRVTVGHVTQMSLVPPARFAQIAAALARAGVAVTVLPATDLYLMGRSHDHAVPRGVAPAGLLRDAGVLCSVATNNVLNPFTPYGDANLLRMANLYANVCHVAGGFGGLPGYGDVRRGAADAGGGVWHSGWRCCGFGAARRGGCGVRGGGAGAAALGG